MRCHDLKCWPGPYEDVIAGRKTYEIRKDDRGYLVGDLLRLREWNPTGECDGRSDGMYTGRETLARVVHRTTGGAWGLPADLCVLGIEIDDEVGRPKALLAAPPPSPGREALRNADDAFARGNPAMSNKAPTPTRTIIERHPIAVASHPVILVPAGAEPLHVGVYESQPHVWCRVDPDAPLVGMRLRMAWDGEDAGPGVGRYVGSFGFLGNVHHVFTEVTDV